MSNPIEDSDKRHVVATPGGRLADFFGIDLRTLGLVRVLCAALVLWTLALLYQDMEVFFTDAGVYPLALWEKHTSEELFFSIHGLSGELWWQRLVFGVHGVFAVMLLVGYRTRLASVMTWLLLVSLLHRNGVIVHSGDTVLCLMLLWGILCPWGGRFSVDAVMGRGGDRPQRVTTVATAGLLLQMPLIYWFSVGAKVPDDSWAADGSAVFYALTPELVTGLGQFLVERLPYGLTRALTMATLVIEVVAPLLILFVPLVFAPAKIRRRWLARFRVAGIALLTGLQLGLVLTLSLGLFPLISTMATLAALPSSAWQWLARVLRGGRLEKFRQQAIAWLEARLRARRCRWNTSIFTEAVAALLLVIIVLTGIASTPYFFVPDEIYRVQKALRIQQTWWMFAAPIHGSGHYQLKAVMSDGTTVDLFGDLGPITADSARRPSAEFPTTLRASAIYARYRWRRYLWTVRDDDEESVEHRGYYARYICRRWNDALQMEPPVERLRFYRMVHTDDRLTQGFFDAPEPKLLIDHRCDEATRK